MHPSLTIKQQFAVFGIICLLTTSSVLVGANLKYSDSQQKFIKTKVSDILKDTAFQILISKALAESAKIRQKFEVALQAARSLSQTFEGSKIRKENGEKLVEIDRDGVNGILKHILRKNKDFAATYTCWEPGAFDEIDVIFKGMISIGYDDSGRLIPLWSRDHKGDIPKNPEPLTDYENQQLLETGIRKGEYYLRPKDVFSGHAKDAREFVIDPFKRKGKDALIISLVTSIIYDDKFYGIAGIDLTLDHLQEMVEKTDKELFEGKGEIVVISHNGIIAAHSELSDFRGKTLDKIIKVSWNEKLERLQKGDPLIEYGVSQEQVSLYVPISFGETRTLWAVLIRMPKEDILRSAVVIDNDLRDRSRNSLKRQVAVSIGVTIIGVFMLLVLATRIAGPVQQTIHDLDNGSEELFSASSQISSSSQTLAELISELAASTEEIASSLRQTSAIARQNADYSKQSDEIVRKSAQTCHEAARITEKLTASMHRIAVAGSETQEIIRTINEIAFQTNLLSLNAAIESARVGEVGAGFSVVAGEVRTLAMKAADAARNTEKLIRSTINEVQEGSGFVLSINKTIAEIGAESENIKKLISGIASASEEQFRGVDMISNAVNQINVQIQQNSATAEEFAGASEELNAHAEQMKRNAASLIKLTGTG